METASGEQRRMFLWMKAALQYPGLNQFIQEIKRAEYYQGAVTIESFHKAVEFARSFNEYQIRSLAIPESEKDDIVQLEMIRLKEVEIRIIETLKYLGWIK